MAYTTIDDPTQYFNTVTYTGDDASTRNITGVGHQPDWVWIKNRGYANKHVLFDSVRGVNKSLTSNSTAAEVDQNSDGGYVSAFNSDGFTLTEGSSSDNDTNDDRYTYVSWNWKAGTSFTNDASATGIGSLDSAGSVNETAGFSIVTYSAVGANHTVKHGLSTTPDLIIFKSRNSSSQGWVVYHKDIANTKFVRLNETDAANTSTDGSGNFNSTSPTSSVFSIGTALATGENGKNIVCYCFSERKGYSKFGSYTGNGNDDGTFVYTGFKPAFTILKKSSGTDNWVLHDNKRSDVPNANANDQVVYPNSTAAELSSSTRTIDTVSNGFKCRGSGGNINASGETYIYLAFAESPFVNSNGVPTNAR